MNEEELELLVTLDDPEDGPEEDTFHVQAKETLECWPGQRCQFDQRAEADSERAHTSPQSPDATASPGSGFD